MQASFSAWLKSVCSTFSRKKSNKLLSEGMESLYLLLYSNASSMVVHMNSESLVAKLSSRGFPSFEKII